ncbi:PAC4 domain containing protein [Pyrenophora teres f. maculata]|nr:PAC4 domain containing protein [Pyrenophora teres f. maculata]
MAAATTNSDASHAPIEVAFPLPKAPHTNIHLQLTDNGPNLLLFLTTATPESASSTPMGSFVYAMPNKATPAKTLSTPLFTHGSTLDFTTRLAKVLARKTGKPVYVGNSLSFASAGMGGTVEEEMEGFRRVVEVVMSLLKEKK